ELLVAEPREGARHRHVPLVRVRTNRALASAREVARRASEQGDGVATPAVLGRDPEERDDRLRRDSRRGYETDQASVRRVGELVVARLVLEPEEERRLPARVVGVEAPVEASLDDVRDGRLEHGVADLLPRAV